MATAKDRLSANMQALSYAMGLAQPAEQPLDVNIGGRYRAGIRDQLAVDPTYSEGSYNSPIYVKGQPLRNAVNFLGAATGIPTKRYWESREAEAEAYEQALTDQRAGLEIQHNRLLQNAERIGGMTTNPDEREQIAELVAEANDAVAQYEMFADPEQRAGALERHSQLASRLKTLTDAAITERTKFFREHYRDEIKSQRSGIEAVDSAFVQSKLGLNSILAKLDEIDEASAEGQAVLREALGASQARYTSMGAAGLGAVGSVLGGVPNPYVAGIGAIASGIGAFAGKEDQKLSKDEVIKIILKADAAADELTTGFRDQLVRSHLRTTEEARAFGFVPGESWRSERYEVDAPYVEHFRGRYFPEGLGPRPERDKPDPDRQRDANTADYLRRRADRIDARNNRRPTR